uniref:Uncharacterized protein n=1 Tax=Triticum urartu TaxID=4572 RepID=A0A8R7QU18_TRIUA
MGRARTSITRSRAVRARLSRWTTDSWRRKSRARVSSTWSTARVLCSGSVLGRSSKLSSLLSRTPLATRSTNMTAHAASSRPAATMTLTASITIMYPSTSGSTTAPSSTTTTGSSTSQSPAIWSLMQQTRRTSPGSSIIVVNQTQRCRNGL